MAGFVEVTVLIGFLGIVHDYSFGHFVVGGVTLAKWALENATISIGKALLFQLLFRGYCQYTLAEGIGFWSAAEVLSGLSVILIFGGSNLDLVGLPIVFMVGLFWSLTLRRTHGLWFAIGMQAAFDFGATFLYSVRDPSFEVAIEHHLSNASLQGSVWLTGGNMGVTGSPLRIVTIAILVFLVNKFYPAKTSESIA